MGKLNQVIAVVAGKKKKAEATVTEIYHKIQKSTLFEGISRVYSPKDDDPSNPAGERLPKEEKLVQVKVNDLVKEASMAWTEMFDLIATQDSANRIATADVKIDGKAILKDVPVTHLLFLEKQITDVVTFIGKLPILDPSEAWNYNSSLDSYASSPSETTRTKKVPKAFVKYEATKEHPAQVDTFTEDILVGYWTTIKSSGAIPAKVKNDMLVRARKFLEAIVNAREEANSLEVTPVHEGKEVFDFIFGGTA